MASSRTRCRPLFSLEQMLEGKTTLKTQKVTHRNIICVGSDILKDIETFMNGDKDEAVRKAIEETESKLLDERQKVIDEIVEKLRSENNETLEEVRKRAELEIEAVKYRCEVAEKKRSRIAQQKFKKEKQEALQKATDEATKMRKEAVALAERQLCEKLLIESEERRREAVDQTRREMQEEADIRIKEAVKNTEKFCETTAAAHLAEVQKRHEMDIATLEAKLEDLTSALKSQKNEKEEFEKLFVDLKEDYKRFQNYTRGFSSDYLMK